ncbi:FUSC family protein [Amycolatopsis sp.]|uniref:FUSC family protein n=1 Tax=Amycolatopsis sp. TaxID=37632 RepID=UPI002CF6ED32|nr:FUSC family protein [Amycolatopsis sp.]HVV12600.1 FUSC family protein [Amycolatopsis sp.]
MPGSGVAEIGRNLWGRFCSSDPGLSQFQLAARAVVSVAVGILVGFGGAHLTGQQPLIPIMLCAVLSLNIGFTVAEPTRGARLVTVVLMPVPVAAGMVLAALLAPRHVAALAGFVVVMFVAVWIRRFGPRFAAYGLMAWMSYFMSMFTGIGFDRLLPVFAVVGLETVAMVVLQVGVFQVRPDRVLARMVRAFHARVAAVADTSLAQVDGARAGGRTDRRQRIRLIRLNEAALLIDGQLGIAGSLPTGWSEEAVRHELLTAEFAVGTVAATAERLRDERSAVTPRELANVREALIALRRGDLAAAEAAGERLTALGLGAGNGYAAAAAAYRLGSAVVDLVRAQRNVEAVPEAGPAESRFTPSVELLNGRLPGSAPLATQFDDGAGSGWRARIARMPLPTRQALQVSLASAVAIVLGSMISEQRYYWAALACFVTFTGTATAAETVSKAFDRALGTLVGVGVAIFFANLTHGNLVGVLIVIFGSVLAGFFLMRFTYVLAVVFITTMVGQLYGVLHEFSDSLLLLRVEETALGAVIGSAVALCFLPTSTRRVARTARRNFFVAAADLLAETGDQLKDSRGDRSALRGSARAADAALQQLLLTTRPWTLPALFGAESPFPGARNLRHRLTAYSMLAAQVRSLAVLATADPRPPVHLAHDLSRICGLLAARLRALDESPLETDGVSRSLDAIGLTLVSWYGVTSEHPRRIVAALRHLDETSRRIAGAQPCAEPVVAEEKPPMVTRTVETEGTVRGSVSGVDARPVCAVVTLIDQAGRQVGRAQTRQGRYCLRPPGVGAYLLVVTPGSSSAKTTPRAVPILTGRQPVTCDVVLPGTPLPS